MADSDNKETVRRNSFTGSVLINPQLFHQSLIILLTFLLQLDIFQHLIFQTLDDCDCILIDKEKKVAFTEGKNDCHKYQYPRLLSG